MSLTINAVHHTCLVVVVGVSSAAPRRIVYVELNVFCKACQVLLNDNSVTLAVSGMIGNSEHSTNRQQIFAELIMMLCLKHDVLDGS
jgi:hypothetical protein